MTHRTLLQSFRFWFVLLSLFALAVAWKLDLFGNRRGLRSAPKVVDETLPEVEADVEPVPMLNDVAGLAEAPAPEPADPRPRALTARREPVRQNRQAEQEEGKVAATAKTTSPPAKNPFGPANPEFVAMPENAPSVFESKRSKPLAAAPGSLEIIDDSQPRRTASLEPTPPDLTQPRPLPSEIAEGRSRPAGFTTDERFQRASNSQTAASEGIERAAVGSPSATSFQLSPESKVNMAAIRQLIEAGDDIEAHRQMSEWYWKEPESRPAFQAQLEQLAKKIYLQPQPHYMDAHVVAPGQMLSTVAREYNVPWQYLAKLNRTDAKRIKPGQKLKVIKGPFSAVVDLSDFELTIHCHGYFVKRYDVGIGRDNSSPYGSFKVQDKLTDPTYYGPTQVIEHDDPENPLGEHWISIGDSFGIHGTIDPQSIGKAESEGCIRLRNEDVAEVYDFLSIGSDVVIRP
jgi:lipoprotein-anchoring transpeptidase ErfK/SrfK